MLFARLFGARRDEDDEPTARPVPPVRVRNAPPAGSALATSVAIPASKAAGPAPNNPSDGKQTAAGFDPYNSGAFKKSNAWERVNRR